MSRKITLAFAGSGVVKQETVRALLDDWLGFGPLDEKGFPEPSENDISLIFPISADHLTTGLKGVLEWSEYADLPYVAVLEKGARDAELESAVNDAEQVIEAVNVDKKVIDLLDEAEGEKYLVLLWGEEDEPETEHVENLLDLATAVGIKAKDLSDGLDDISFDEEDAEPEPEPAPEPPARGRRGAAAKKEEVLVDEEEPLTETVAEAVVEEKPKPARAPRATKAETKEEPVKADYTAEKVAEAAEVSEGVKVAEAAIDVDYINGVIHAALLHHQKVDESNALRNLDEVRESPMTTLLREALLHTTVLTEAAAPQAEEAVVEEPAEPVKRGRGRPRSKPVEEETIGYLVDQDGIYRKAGRGRPRRGEKKVDLTTAQIADLTAKGLVDDEE